MFLGVWLEKKGLSPEEELRRLVAELQVLEELANSLQTRIGVIEAAITELRTAQRTLEGLEKEGVESELLIPIGGSSFITARLQSIEKIVVGVGAGVAVEKSLEDAKKSISERIATMERARDAYRARLGEVLKRLQAGRDRAQALASELRRWGEGA
ncbi:prefoldin subunit alpha [Candidatus Bathyarchaeota archaeon]|nr:MAG: prefoldin subunit alpha [Candidatus Bathyarchaeota archaeon]